MKVKGKVAIITGGASGIGATCAQRFIREGAKVVVSDIDERSGRETVAILQREGGESLFIRTDVTRAEDIERMVSYTFEKYGRLDILFNNAGINPVGDVVGTHLEEWERVMAVNLRGVFLGCKYGIPVMIRSGGGSILNMGSVAGLEAGPFSQVAYEASKAGVIAISRSAARDYAAKNIRVNCICPGGTLTPLITKVMETMDPKLREAYINLHPLKRLAQPEEIASLAVFLASDESSYITGAAIAIDGGRTTGISLIVQ